MNSKQRRKQQRLSFSLVQTIVNKMKEMVANNDVSLAREELLKCITEWERGIK